MSHRFFIQLLALMSLMNFKALSSAEPMDPSKPPTPTQAVEETPEVQSLEGPIDLQGFLKIGNESKVIINGVTLRVGNQVAGYTIHKIDKPEVVLKKLTGEEITLSLTRPIKTSSRLNIKLDSVNLKRQIQETLVSYSKFQKNLADCTRSIHTLAVPSESGASLFPQEIIGELASKSCLVIHKLNEFTFQCEYPQSVRNTLSTPKTLDKISEAYQQLALQMSEGKLHTLNVIKPTYCVTL